MFQPLICTIYVAGTCAEWREAKFPSAEEGVEGVENVLGETQDWSPASTNPRFMSLCLLSMHSLIKSFNIYSEEGIINYSYCQRNQAPIMDRFEFTGNTLLFA